MTIEDLKGILDLNRREVVVFAPLVGLVLWMGIYPAPFIDIFSASVSNLIADHQASLAAASGDALVALGSPR